MHILYLIHEENMLKREKNQKLFYILKNKMFLIIKKIEKNYFSKG